MLRHALRITAALMALVAVPLPAAAQPPAAPVLQASAAGQTVSASWTAIAGATNYRVEAGLTAGVMLAGYDLGPLTSFSISAPQGVYFLRVLARNASGSSAPSNVVMVSVTSTQGPPAAPTNFAASVNGSTVTLTANLPNTTLTGLLLVGGVTPGASQGVVPLSVSPENTLTNVPPGTYFTRLVAVNPGGSSPPSNEVQFVVTAPSCGPPAAPALTAETSGTAVVLSWTAIGGAAGYRVDVATSPGGAPIASQPVGPQVTALSNPNAPAGTYYVRVTVINACGQAATSSEVTLVVTPNPGGNRTPNPPPGQFLPLPNRQSVVEEVANQYRGDLLNSCVTNGGNNTWLFRLVQRLRQEDTRWGLNWKRGRIGDLSQDIVTYNAGSQADEGTHEIYVIDVIGGHCGSNPGPTWINQTGVGGADAIWTLQPYTSAGFPR
ncbi:MAG TPA: hypothetical protein VMW48_15215 [Vicinamibacterales bacterium]|nr:hypothetical protein [Vicinamibacterales bacterium]